MEFYLKTVAWFIGAECSHSNRKLGFFGGMSVVVHTGLSSSVSAAAPHKVSDVARIDINHGKPDASHCWILAPGEQRDSHPCS